MVVAAAEAAVGLAHRHRAPPPPRHARRRRVPPAEGVGTLRELPTIDLLNVLPFAILLLPLAGLRRARAVRRLDQARAASRRRRRRASPAPPCSVAFALAVAGDAAALGLAGRRTRACASRSRYLGFEWIDVGGFHVPMSLLVDPLSCVMMLVVTGVGSLIHVYSVGYMAHDEDRVRFFSYLNLFTFFMLLLVLGGSLPLLFVGWEGVGLCSYLLIGFWYRKDSASAAGLKAFVVNRIGDVGLILGMIFIVPRVRQPRPRGHRRQRRRAGAARRLWQWGPATIACLLLFVGATGKSAQIPLHVWLPDAMEGPTPVSALIHAATMVTAGVYLVARARAALRTCRATALLVVVAVIGAATALLAGDDRASSRPTSSTCSRTRPSASSASCSSPPASGAFGVGGLPPLHARLLQGAALPRLRLGDPRDVGRAGHAQDGRPAQARSRSRSGPSSSARWRSPASRCSPASSARTRSCGRGLRHRPPRAVRASRSSPRS